MVTRDGKRIRVKKAASGARNRAEALAIERAERAKLALVQVERPASSSDETGPAITWMRAPGSPRTEAEVEGWLSDGFARAGRDHDRQVACLAGIADVVTLHEAIEVKKTLDARSIKRAVGQAIVYAETLGRKPAIAGVVAVADRSILKIVPAYVAVYAFEVPAGILRDAVGLLDGPPPGEVRP